MLIQLLLIQLLLVQLVLIELLLLLSSSNIGVHRTLAQAGRP